MSLDAGFKVCIEPLAVVTQNLLSVPEARDMVAEIGLQCRRHRHLQRSSRSGRHAEIGQRPTSCTTTTTPISTAALRLGRHGFVPIMKALLDIGYQRYASIEVFDFEPDAYEHCKKGYETLKAACEQAAGWPSQGSESATAPVPALSSWQRGPSPHRHPPSTPATCWSSACISAEDPSWTGMWLW